VPALAKGSYKKKEGEVLKKPLLRTGQGGMLQPKRKKNCIEANKNNDEEERRELRSFAVVGGQPLPLESKLWGKGNRGFSRHRQEDRDARGGGGEKNRRNDARKKRKEGKLEAGFRGQSSANPRPVPRAKKEKGGKKREGPRPIPSL